MADKTKIEWADATVNAINGCSLESPGCTNCYAMKQAHRFDVRRGLTTKTKGGMVWTGDVRLNEKALLQPLAWKRPRRIFWNAHGDTFHDAVPDEWIDRVMAVCALTPQHTHMILTKRSKRMREYLIRRKDAAPIMVPVGDGTLGQHPWNNELKVPPNVWLGVSVEDQTRADERIPDLLATPAAVRFLSCEPLLGPVDLRSICDGWSFWGPLGGRRWHDGDGEGPAYSEPCPKIDWVIAGGESGPGARPMHSDWARSLRDQCAAASLPFHFKQNGEYASVSEVEGPGEHYQFPDGATVRKVGKKRAGRLLDGVEHNGRPGQPA